MGILGLVASGGAGVCTLLAIAALWTGRYVNVDFVQLNEHLHFGPFMIANSYLSDTGHTNKIDVHLRCERHEVQTDGRYEAASQNCISSCQSKQAFAVLALLGFALACIFACVRIVLARDEFGRLWLRRLVFGFSIVGVVGCLVVVAIYGAEISEGVSFADVALGATTRTRFGMCAYKVDDYAGVDVKTNLGAGYWITVAALLLGCAVVALQLAEMIVGSTGDKTPLGAKLTADILRGNDEAPMPTKYELREIQRARDPSASVGSLADNL